MQQTVGVRISVNGVLAVFLVDGVNDGTERVDAEILREGARGQEECEKNRQVFQARGSYRLAISGQRAAGRAHGG